MRSRYNKLLLGLVTGYITFFSIYSGLRLYAFENVYAPGRILVDTHAFYSSLLNTIRGHGFFYNPYEGTSHFAVHNSPILFLLLPIVALFPYIETILVVQSVFIGFGAVTLFYFAKTVLEDEKSALLISAMYLISPFIHGINKSDFHACALAIPFMFLTAYFYETKRIKLMFISAFLVLSAKEDAGLFLISLAWLYIIRKNSLIKSLNPRTWLKNREEFALLIAGVLWIVLSLVIICGFNGWAFPRWSRLYGGTFNILTWRGLVFIGSVLISLGVLPILAPRYLVASLFLWLELLLGSSFAMVSYDFYYSYMLVPFLYIVAVYATSRHPQIIRIGFLISLGFSILFSPVWGITRIGPNDSIYFWIRFFI